MHIKEHEADDGCFLNAGSGNDEEMALLRLSLACVFLGRAAMRWIWVWRRVVRADSWKMGT